jgi:hypothetical protein
MSSRLHASTLSNRLLLTAFGSVGGFASPEPTLRDVAFLVTVCYLGLSDAWSRSGSLPVPELVLAMTIRDPADLELRDEESNG